MKHHLAACVLFLTCLLPVATAAQDGRIYPDYDAMRAALDEPLMRTDLLGAFNAMLPPEVVPVSQVQSVQSIFQDALPNGATDSAVLYSRGGDNGFRQELIGFWSGATYMFAIVTFHDRGGDDGVVVFNLNIQGQIGDALALF